ncbi:MAG: mechanosensitive ion channel family protein [Sporichthyaceae bacterium]
MVLALSPLTGLINADTTDCTKDDGTLCGVVFDVTGQKWLAESSDWLIAKPARILLIILVAALLRSLIARVIKRLSTRAAEGSLPGLLARGRTSGLLGSTPLVSERRAQRAATMGSVLGSIATGVIASIALIMVIAELGVSIAPLIASAGIVGVALGFGAQSLVKDFLSGIFMILEDQYGVGDVIDAGEASGVVEAVGLRVTRLRDVSGVVWYLRNGEIPRVGNMSQGWARAVLDIGVAYHEDVARVRELILDTAQELYADEDYRDLVLDEPEVWGVEALEHDAIVIRLVAKTKPLQQWAVARALRERIKATFDEHGVEIPFPQRTVWMRAEGPGSEAGAEPATPDTGTAPDRPRRPAAAGEASTPVGSRQQVRSEYTGEMAAVVDDPPPKDDVRGT